MSASAFDVAQARELAPLQFMFRVSSFIIEKERR
jgi:hypothetical protein